MNVESKLCVCYQKGLQNFHNIKTDLKEVGSEVWVGFMWLMVGYGWQAVLSMIMNLISIKGTILLNKMSDCQVLKDSAPWSW